jgi:RNA polymerase sigma-70 factor (ECF subfamily)
MTRLAHGVADEELVRRIQAGGDGPGADAAAEALFGRYRQRVYLWCFRYVREHERALDLAQDVLLNAWRALARFDERAPFACWLYAITRNRCYSALRPVSMARDEETDPDTMVDGGPDPEARFEQEQGEAAMLDMLAGTLDRVEQDALYLRCWERLPVEEITRQLEIPGASGARGVLQTARRKLRAALARRMQELSS